MEYYKYAFDVTTDEIISRVKHACFPAKSESIFGPNGKYDLYGPIWTILTLNIMIFIFGNIAGYFDALANETTDYKTEALRITSSTSFMTFYFLVVPLALWGLIRLTGEDLKSHDSRPDYFFLVSVYGYSFVPFMPAIVFYVIPSNPVKWAVLLIAGGVSLMFLAKEMFGRVAQTLDGKSMKIASIAMLVLHLFFILALKWKFL